MSNRMTNDDLIKLGFKPIPHFTVNNAVIYDLGRNRHLSAGDVGTPNEMIFIGEIDSEDDKKITDCICLHNYDYDGYVTEQKVKLLIEALTNDLWFKKREYFTNDDNCKFKTDDVKNPFEDSQPTLVDISTIEQLNPLNDSSKLLEEMRKKEEKLKSKKSYKDLYNDYLTEIQFNNRIQFKIPFCEWLDNKFN